PLLVAVRSGAAISMPGMMDTILNVGLNDVSVEGLARATGNEWFAHDCYRRLLEMYGETVDGVHYERLGADETPQHAIARLKRGYRESTRGDFPQDPREQLRRAGGAGVRTLQSPPPPAPPRGLT